jgi:stress-induced morphogen
MSRLRAQTRNSADIETQVQDISGGCGSMYALDIESPKFKGLTVIKQHKLVNQVLKEEIAQWHGVQLRTKAA